MTQDDIFYDREPWTLTIRIEDVEDDAVVVPDEIQLIFRERTGRSSIVYEYPAAAEIKEVGGLLVFTNHYTRDGSYDVFVVVDTHIRAVGSVPLVIEKTPTI